MSDEHSVQAARSPPLGTDHPALEACAPLKPESAFSFLSHLGQSPPMCFFHGCRIGQNGCGGRKAYFQEEGLLHTAKLERDKRE